MSSGRGLSALRTPSGRSAGRPKAAAEPGGPAVAVRERMKADPLAVHDGDDLDEPQRASSTVLGRVPTGRWVSSWSSPAWIPPSSRASPRRGPPTRRPSSRRSRRPGGDRRPPRSRPAPARSGHHESARRSRLPGRGSPGRAGDASRRPRPGPATHDPPPRRRVRAPGRRCWPRCERGQRDHHHPGRAPASAAKVSRERRRMRSAPGSAAVVARRPWRPWRRTVANLGRGRRLRRGRRTAEVVNGRECRAGRRRTRPSHRAGSPASRRPPLPAAPARSVPGLCRSGSGRDSPTPNRSMLASMNCLCCSAVNAARWIGRGPKVLGEHRAAEHHLVRDRLLDPLVLAQLVSCGDLAHQLAQPAVSQPQGEGGAGP